jgi:AbiV family abortive infection protein
LAAPKNLLDLWRNSVAGSVVTLREVKALKNHEAKQRAGMRSLSMKPEPGSDLAKILAARTAHAHDPQSQGWKEADEALRKADAELAEQAPNDRHKTRMRALYVEPKSSTEWNRPADISAEEAYDFLQVALNDYKGQYDRWYITSDTSILLLEEDDPALYKALEGLSDRPVLPWLQGPNWPTK